MNPTYYRRLIKHSGSLMVCVPSAILRTWGARRGHHVRFVIHPDSTVTVQLVEERIHAENPYQDPLAFPDTAPYAAPTHHD